MSRLRWGDDIPADAQAARTRLMDAADACMDRFGLTKTTIEDVAAEAKVSRATIYRYFDSRDDLVMAVLLRGLRRRMAPSVSRHFAEARTPEQFGAGLVESAVHLLDAIRHDPKLAVLLDRDSRGLSATITGASEVLFRTVLAEWSPLLARCQAAGLLRGDLQVDELGEWLLRAILSLLTVEGPTPHTAEDERRLLATYLVPAIVSHQTEAVPSGQ